MRPVNGEMYAQWLDHKKDFGSSRLSKNAGKSKFLCSTFGEQLPFVVRMTGKRLQVANISDGSLLYFAHLDGNIVDVDYLPTAEGKFGLLVGIEEDMGEAGARHSISIITTGTDEKQKKLVPIASMSIPYQITVLKTVLSDEDMKKRKNIRLNSKLSQWNNIIVVGTKWCHCYLTSLAAVEGADEVPMQTKIANDILANLVQNDYMMYPMDEERHKKLPRTAVRVTSLAFLTRSRTLVVGLSMGGMIFASLNPSNKLDYATMVHEQPIRFVAPMEPEDDPDKTEWLLVGFDASPRHSICLGLYEAAFRTPGYQNLPLEEKFDKPHFSPKMVHEISYGSEWVSMRPIACHRNVDGNPRRVGCSFEPNDSSLVNVSSTSVLSTVSNFGHHRNRSRAFFTYSRFNEKVKDSLTLAGGIFDVNAYYYKRFPPNLSLDRTLLKQCPFVSWIRSGLNAANVEDFAVLTDDLCDIAQMKSAISDADQLFYPSALDFDRAFVVESGILRPMHVTNLPTQVLDRIVKNLADVLVAPTSAAELLRSAGLVPASVNHLDASPTGEQELNPSEKTVLVAVLHYGRVEALVKLLKSPSITTERKMDIVKWVWNEACAFRSVINERTVSVFAGTSTALSPLASTSLVHGVRLFTDIAYFLASANVDSRFAAKFKRYEMAVRCMKSHTELVHRFVSAHLVPLSEHDAERIVQEHQKKQSAAHRNGKTLPVDFLLKRLHEKTRGMHFWMRKSPDEWYPPPPLNLLEPILNFSLDERTKRELLVYFVADWITASRTYQKSLSVEALAIKVLAVISDGMLGADLEKVKYLLSQVDLAVKRAEEKSSVASQAKENQPVESDDEIPKSELKLSDEVVEDFSDILDKKQKILTNVVSTVGDSRDDEYERRRLLFLYSQQRFAEIRNVFHDDQNKDRDDAFRQLSPYLFAGPSNKTTTVDPEEKAKADQRAATVQALFARETKNKAAELQRIDATGIFANFGYGGGLGGLPKHGRAKKRTIVERSPSKEKKENEAILPAAKRKSTGLFGSPQAKTLPTPTNESPVTVDSMDDEIHAAIQTPARHLRPRTFVPDGEFSPPIEAIPTVTKAPASILKKPRTEASPSRGHIRFVGLPKLSDSPESPVTVDPKAPAPRFAMDLTDESDEEMEFDGQVSRSDFLKKPVEQKEPEQVDVEDECIEMEKTFEKAEDTGFEVAEDVTPEDVTPEEAAQEDVTPEKSSPEDVTPDLTTPEVVTNEEAASEDVTPEEVAPEDVTPEGEASEDVTPEEVALEAVKEVLALNEPEEANEELEKSMEVQSDADEPVFVIITEEGEDEILDVKVEREEGLEKSTEVQAEEPGKEEEEGPLNATFTIERAETPVVEPEELMYGVSFDDDGVERSFEIQADEKKDLESGPIGSMFVREKSPEAQIEVEVEEKKAKTPSRSSSRLSTRSRQASEEPVEKPTPKARRSTRAASKVATPAAPASSTTTISPSRQRGTPRTRLFSEQTVQVVDDSAASAKRKTRSQSVTANTADEATAPKRGRYDWRSKLEKGLKELEESRKMEKPAEEAEVQAPGSTTKRGTRSRTTSNSSTADVQTPSKRTRATTKAAMETLVEVEDSEPTSTRRTARSRTTSTSSTVPTSPKRGRPPKNTEAKETPSSAAKKTPRSRTNSVSSTTTNAETPSKRGRPPKVALETVEEDVEAMTTTASAKRAPRSRTASTSSTVNPVPETPNTQKRRGRPPKATLEPITDNSPPASTTRRTRRTPSRTTD